MNNQTPTTKTVRRRYVTIGDASELLGVSIDTVRRWEKSGKLESKRLDGKNRYFAVDDLEKYKNEKPLTTSQVANLLKVSPSSVRRLEANGQLVTDRDNSGRRHFSQKSVSEFIEGKQEKDNKPLSRPEHVANKSHDSPGEITNQFRIQGLQQNLETRPDEKSLKRSKTAALISLAKDTAKQASLSISPTAARTIAKAKNLNKFYVAGGALAILVVLVAGVVFPRSDGSLSTDNEGKISVKFPLHLSDSSFIKIPDQGLVKNLNSEFVNGYRPGEQAGDLAILPIKTNHIEDGTIQLNDLSQALISSLGASSSGGSTGQTVTSGLQGPIGPAGPQGAAGVTGPQGPAGSAADISTGNSTEFSGGDLEVRLAAGGSTSTAGSASGLEVAGNGLRLLGGCAANQILKWNGSSWVCSTDIGSSASINVQESDGSPIVNSINTLQFGPDTSSSDEFVLTNLGGGQVRVELGTEVLLTSNYATTLDPIYVNPTETPVAGDISGSYSAGFTIGSNSVALATDTTGNYVSNITTAQGLSVSGLGVENATANLSLDVSTAGTTATISSNSGLEVGADGLRLLGGCSTNQILKWNGTNWVCSADSSTAISVEVDDSVLIASATSFDFLGSDFNITNSSGEANIALDYVNSGITRRNQTEIITGAWTFDDSALTIRDNADNTKQIDFELAALTTGITRTLSVPDTDGTLITSGNLSSITSVGTITVGTWNGTALTDTYVSDTLTIGASSTVADGALSANVTLLGATITKDELTGTGVLGFSWSNTEVADDLTISASGSVADGALSANVSLLGSAIDLGTGEVSGVLGSANGGTGINGSGAVNGSLLIGNGSGYTLAVLGEGNGISIGNGSGSINISLDVQANKGLEADGNGLSLIDCSNNEILKYSTGTGQWSCATDGGGGSVAVEEGDSGVVAVLTSLDFNASDFAVSETPAGEANVSIDYANSNITRSNQAETISGSWLFTDNGFSVRDNVDTSKQLNFQLSGISTSTTRTLAAPDASGTIITTGNLTDVNTVGTVATGTWQASNVGAQYGGTGINGSSAANGSLLIGNGSGYSLSTLTQGNGISISNGAGSINIAANVQANKGIESDGNGLSLIDCSANEVLKYISGSWVCAADNGTGSAPTLQEVYDNDADGSNAVINLSSADGGIRIRDNVTPIGINLFAVQDNDGSTNYFAVNASGVTTTGTVNGANISGGSLSASAVNGLSVSGGTITVGTWNGTALTDTYVSDTLTIGASSTVADGALSANVTLLGATITKDELTGTGVLGFSWSNTEVADDLTISASGSVADGALSANVSLLGSAIDLATAEVAGNLLASNLQNSATDLGGADVNINLTNSNAGGFVTNLILDGTITATTFSGSLTGNVTGNVSGNAGTATALAANPADCAANQFAITIAASGDLGCAAITDTDVPNSITIDLAAAATALAANPTDCAANQFATAIAASGNLTCAALTDSDVPDTLTIGASSTVADGALSANVTLLGSDININTETTGNLLANRLQTAGTDLGAANVNIDLSNTNGAFVTNLTVDGTVMSSTSINSPLFTNAGQVVLSATGAGNDITLTAADKIVFTGFNCTTFDNGGVLTTDASGNITCDNDDGGAAGTITGSGTTNRIPLYTGSNSLGNSWILQNGATLQIDSGRNLELIAGDLTLTSGNVDVSGTLTSGTADAFQVTATGNVTAGTFNTATISGGTLSGGVVSGGSLSASAVNGLSVSGGTISSGVWNGTAIGAQYGGTGINTSISTGIATVSSGTWSIAASLTDAQVSDTLTIGASSTVADGALSANVTLLGATITKDELTGTGVLGFSWSNTEVADDLTISASGSVADGALSANVSLLGSAIDLATAEVAGNLLASNLQNSATDLGGADVNINLTNSNAGGFVTNLILDGTITATTFSGSLTGNVTGNVSGNAGTATALAANPADCAANQFAITIAASGDLGCAAITDTDVPNSITIDLAAAATALAANPTDCAANQFATAIAASGNLTCAALTDSDVPDTLTIGASSTVADGALSANVTLLGSDININTETTGNLLANRLQTAGTDLGAANVNIDLSNTNGAFVTNLTVDGTITAATFSGNLTGNVTGNASTATQLAADPSDCAANQFANAIAASGNLTCAALTDSDVPDTLTIGASSTVADGALSANVTLLGATITKDELTGTGVLGFSWSNTEVADDLTISASGSVADGALSANVSLLGSAIDLATAEVAGNLLASNLQNSATDLGGADVNINLTNSNAGGFVTNLILDGTITATTFSGSLTGNVTGNVSGNAGTATALAANPADCAANQFAITIAASGDLGCAAITDTDVPNSITIDLAAAATALAANPTDCAANQFATAIAASGNLTCAALTDSDVPDTLTIGASSTVADGALSANVTLLGSDININTETTGNLLANRLQTAGTDLGAANVNIDLSNTNGAFVTNLTVDGTITAATFSGNLTGNVTGNASTATQLAADPSDCAANQFANAIAASGNLTCAALTDSDVPDTLTIGASSTVADGALSANVTLLGATITKDELTGTGVLGFSWSNTEVADDLTISASGSVADGALSANVSLLGSAIDLATAEVAGNLLASNLQNSATDLGGADVNINLTNSNAGGFVTNLILDGTITATTFSGSLTGNVTGNVSGNAGTATALAANPADCAANQFAITIAASGDLGCAAITDTDVPNSITIDLAAAATALAANPTDCAANQFATAIAASGNLTCAALTDSDVPDTLTIGASSTVADGALSANVTLLGSDININTETTGNLLANRLQTAGTDLGAANVNIDLSNTNGAFVTNLTVDGTITAATFSGNLTGNVTGNASTATQLAADPSDCAANQFANAIAASGNLTCSTVSKTALANSGTLGFTWSDAEVSDTLTASIFIGTGSTTNAVDLASGEVSGTLAASNGGTGQSSYTTGDLLYASSSSALSRLSDVATGNVLISGGVSAAPSWGKITNSHLQSGSFTNITGVGTLSGLTVTGGASISGGLNNNIGGITNTGSIAGATTITASGNINTTAVYQKNGVSGATVSCASNQFLGTQVTSGGIITSGTCENDDVGISDQNLKTNIAARSVSLSDIASINVVDYNYRCLEMLPISLSCDDRTGIIAQEVQAIFPELVINHHSGYLAVREKSLLFYGLQATTQLADLLDGDGDVDFDSVNTNQLTVSSGASISGSINNNGGGITSTGTISGVTAISSTASFTLGLNTAVIDTTLSINNTSVTGVAHLNIVEGTLQTAGTTRITNSGNLQNIGTISASGSINTTNGGLQTNGTTRVTNAGGLSNITSINSSGSVTFDLNTAVASNALIITNTGLTGTANLNLDDGALQTNGTTRLTNGGALQNISTISASGNINTTGVYQKDGISGISVTCGVDQYLNNIVVSGGINTGTSGCRDDQKSDSRLKKDIAVLDGSSLDKIAGLNIVNYYFDCEHELFTSSNLFCESGQQVGVLAQELVEIFPELVYEAEDGYLRVDYDALGIHNLRAVSEIAKYINSSGDANFNSLEANQILTAGVGQQYSASDASITTGDVVAVNSDGGLIRSNQSYQSGLIGVVTAGQGLIVGGQTEDGVTVAAAGQAQVKVNTQNGPILPGDYLTSSDTPGVAMRATGSGAIIGIAMTGFSGAGQGLVNLAVDNSVLAESLGSQMDELVGQVASLQTRIDELENSGIQQNGENIDLSHLTVGRLDVTLDLFVQGSLIVEGGVEFRDTAFFAGMVTFGDSLLVQGDATFRGVATFNNNTAGYAVVETGAQSVHISFSEPFNNPPLVTLSLGGGKFANYSYDNVTVDGFDIVLQNPATERLEFTWATTSIESPNTFVQQ